MTDERRLPLNPRDPSKPRADAPGALAASPGSSSRRRAAPTTGVAALLVSLLAPVIGSGDDTEIYAPRLDPGFEPTLMFMVDTSGSMKLRDDGGSLWRRDRLLGPLVDYLRTATNLRAGLSTFNGLSRGGAVVQPAEDLDHDVCPAGSCSSVSLRAPILRDADDGKFEHGGRTDLFRGVSEVGRTDDEATHSAYPGSPDDTVVETSAAGAMPAEALTLFRNEAGETTLVGIHFPDVPLGPDVEVLSATLEFNWSGNEYLDPDAGEGSGTANVRITLDRRADSPSFANASGRRVSDRPRTPGHVDWDVSRPNNWEKLGSDFRHRYRSPPLTTLFNQVRGPGTDGTLTVLLEPAPGATIDKTNMVSLLGVRAGEEASIMPELVYTVRDPHKPRPLYTAGLRFDRLDVPKGASVTAAHFEVVSRNDGGGTFDGSIRAEASGDARPFEHRSTDDFGTRTLTSDVVRWRPGEPGDGRRDRSPDISSLVRQVVSRDDWCAGNALVLLIDATEGLREFVNRDAGGLDSPSLHVTYDADSIDAADTCRRQAGPDSLQIASEGDVIEASSGPPVPGSPVYDPDTVDGRRLGLRFADVALDREDEISEANLLLSSVDLAPGTYRSQLEVSVDSDTAEAPFDAPGSLASRVAGEPTVEWISGKLVPGSLVESIDLAALVRRALDDPGWRRGGDIVLTLRRTGRNSVPVATSHSSEAPGPSLRIVKKLRGADAAALPLRTHRDVLIERLQTLPAAGETPLVDAFYETAQYLTGGEVVHGRQRGEQRRPNTVHRLSDPGAYTGGTVARPTGCTADDPDAPECVDETIAGSPVYIAPPTSECRANQIVLVTDGDPSASPAGTAARIRALTGETSCDTPDDSQACATDLARWLAVGGPDRAPVHVSTIGFAFESEFLAAVAREGGGRAFTASSASRLGEALRGIRQTATQDGATLVGPAVSVSQFNRSTHRDDVYLGLFEPAGYGTLWPGNLKRYALGPLPGGDGTDFGLLDADGQAAVDPATGALAAGARSYWSAASDGAAVTEGGAASKLAASRHVLTWPAASDGEHHGARALVPFHEDTAAIVAADLGVAEAERTRAIRWMRGLDVRDEDGDGVTDEPRRRMGAAIHTTPTVLDYPSNAPEGRSVVFAGTQEGFLHAVDTSSGRELFAFLPHELYAGVGAFMEGNPGPMHYGLDGPVTGWASDENRNGIVDPGERAYVTVGMRRGGVHYYTLDVTDPERPSLAWTIDPSRTGFESLRQSWSAMRHARLRADPETSPDGSSVRPALVFASGYDPINDDRTIGLFRGDRRQPGGAMIYLVDPHTGDLLHGATHGRMWYSIPSDIAVVDTGMDGITDLLLVADVSGQLWRVDLVPTRADDGSFEGTAPVVSIPWYLSDHSSNPVRTGDESDRRFFHPPDVALMSDGSGPPVLKVAIGSGRRDHPLETSAQDRLYMLGLDPMEPADATRWGAKYQEGDLHDATDVPNLPPPGKQGWFIDLERSGEKILGTPVIVDGRVLVTTYVPAEDDGSSCAPGLGGGRFLGVDAFTAKPVSGGLGKDDEPVRSIELDAPGIPPPVTVVMSASRPGAPAVMAGTQSVEATEPKARRQRTYWIAD